MTDLQKWLPRGVEAINAWQDAYGAFDQHPSLVVSDEVLGKAFNELTERLRDNYPFGHPRYVGQMLKPPHPAAVLGYTTAMLINPNNHALDGGPATAQMEKEVVARIATMFGFESLATARASWLKRSRISRRCGRLASLTRASKSPTASMPTTRIRECAR